MKRISFVIARVMSQKDLNYLIIIIKQVTPNFASLNSFDKMIWLMTCENSYILNMFAKFVYTCFSLRESAR